jgi:hypothetical protein
MPGADWARRVRDGACRGRHTMWKRMSYARNTKTLGEKIMIFMALLFLLAAGFVVFEFAGFFAGVIKDFLS